MRPIPDSWSDRVPKHISPKRQVMCFHRSFHEELLKQGFVCEVDQPFADKNPDFFRLLQACRYYRIIGHELIQIVDCFLTEMSIAMDNNGIFYRNAGMGGTISIEVYSLHDRLFIRDSMFGYGFDGFCQQRIVGFQFPDMEKSFCNSFLNCYVDDFTFAMELEKELFFEQTLPWLDNVCSIQAYADWRMKIMYKRPVQLRNILDSIWSQMMVKNWENMRAWEDYWKEDPYLSYWKEHEEGKIAFGIQDAISRQDERTLDLLLHENHMNNMQNLKAFCPRLYEQI
ncbi:MAG: hypothetical protein IKH30_10460 [Clostridia bacterium]|nr:hypothetical protein [Clostridia bacterium]